MPLMRLHEDLISRGSPWLKPSTRRATDTLIKSGAPAWRKRILRLSKDLAGRRKRAASIWIFGLSRMLEWISHRASVAMAAPCRNRSDDRDAPRFLRR